MGEIADWLVDQMLDREEWYGGPGLPPPSRCKFCGSADVLWSFRQGQWALMNNDLTAHNCRAAKPDEFPDLS